MKKIGWEAEANENENIGLLRGALNAKLGLLGHDFARKYALENFSKLQVLLYFQVPIKIKRGQHCYD